MFRVLARADLVFLAVRFLGRVAKEAKNIALYGTVLMIVEPLVISLLFQFIDKNTLTAVTSNVPQSTMLFFILLPYATIFMSAVTALATWAASHVISLIWLGRGAATSSPTVPSRLR